VAFPAPALVFEPYNGTVLYAEDPDAQWFPASLTKLMTAYVTFQALKADTVALDTRVVCSQKARAQAPTKLGLPVGGAITLDVALKVLIVKSASDDLDVINGRREQGPLGHARLVKMCPLRRISLSRFWLEALQGAGSMSTLVAPIKALRPSAKTALKPISATETGRWRAIVAGFCSFHLLLA
jgi:hypothetical protein